MLGHIRDSFGKAIMDNIVQGLFVLLLYIILPEVGSELEPFRGTNSASATGSIPAVYPSLVLKYLRNLSSCVFVYPLGNN